MRQPFLASSCGLIAMLSMACHAADERRDKVPVFTVDGPSLVATPVALPTVISPENDAWGFASPIDLRFDGDRLLVLENGNARLVVFDDEYQAVGTMGHEGAGPGELRGVASLEIRSGAYAVSEINNARISVFTAAGDFVRSVPIPSGRASFAFAAAGALYVNADMQEHYLFVVDRNGLRRPFARRPLDRYPTEAVQRAGPFAWSKDLVAVTGDGSIFIYDPLLASLRRFAADGRPTGERRLPTQIRDELTRRRRQVYADFGDTRRVYRAPANDLTVTDEGDLLLLFTNVDGTFGLVIDPSTFSATALTWAEESKEARRGLGGTSGVIRRDTLYQTRGDEVLLYRLDPTDS